MRSISPAQLARLLYVREYKKSKGCIDCPETDWRCLDLDHKDPSEKEFNFNECWRYTIDQIDAELAKCDVRCANCHRKRHIEAE